MAYWKDADSKTVAMHKKLAERMAGPLAKQMVEQTGILQSKEVPLVVLDNACGTGIVSQQLLNMLDDTAKENLDLTCGDFAEGMLKAVEEIANSEGWKNVKIQVMDIQNTGLPSNHFTHVITLFAVMLVPDPTAALEECLRILKPGGVCGISTWRSLGWYLHVRAAIATIEGAPGLPENDIFVNSLGKGGGWHQPSFVKEQLEARGFQDVEVKMASGFPRMSGPEEFTDWASGMITAMVPNFWSDGEVEQFRPLIKPAILKYMTEKYGEGNEFEFEMAAILATGRKV